MINILLVDDDKNNRFTLDLLLEDIQNIKISEAENGKEAVEMCKNKFYDLIFMDIMMPIMDGIEATKEIKKFSKSSMIIALSALENEESKHNMLMAGAEDYLTKPINSEIFIQRTKNYLNIITLRATKFKKTDAINPFTTNVYDRLLSFNIKAESSLTQFWDYFLQRNVVHCKDLSDHIRIIYGLGLWLIKNSIEFNINVEENKDKVYIMLNNINHISKKTIYNLVNKHINNALFTIHNNILAFELVKIEMPNDIVKLQEEANEKDESNIIKIDEETKKVLSKTHNEAISAIEYIEETAISILPKIDSLEEIENKLDDLIINFEKTPTKDSLNELCLKFHEYHKILALLVEFEHLVFAINSLITFLESIDEEKFANENFKNFISLLLHLLNDLTSWRENIFVNQDSIDIHYLDASLLSSCLQIEAIFDDKSVDEGDDLEFF